MKLTHQVLMNHDFGSGIRKIGNCNKLPVKTLYRATKIVQALQKQSEIVNSTMDKLRAAHGVLDETTKLYTIAPEKQADFIKAVKEFEALEFEVNQLGLPLEDLEKAGEALGITPFELAAIEPLIESQPALHVVEAPASIL